MLSRLAPEIKGRRFVGLEAFTEQAGSLLRGELTALRPSARLMRVSRHGKLSLLHFGSSAVVVVQLGMSGRLVLRGPSGRHDHIALHLSGGCTVTYADHRRFGGVYVWPTAEVTRQPPLDAIGPDALDPALDATLFPSGPRAIKEALLDQSVVAGLGNIYACEVLYRTGIDPRRPCSALGLDDRQRLIAAIRCVLAEAVADGGATLSDYRGTEGEAGGFEA
jgi:formamidopyrimidine-DNA glycosylase